MKSVVALSLLSLIALSTVESAPNSRGCFYILGQCKEECPEGTHGYTSACKQKLPEPTCDVPVPELEPGFLCDFSACYCDAPNVRDTATNKCVPLSECPKKE